MPPTASIPRFLLPQRGTIWRTRLPTPPSTFLSVRNASIIKAPPKKEPKPLVLEKPTKFTPPSHGARLRKDPPRYPGPQLGEEEKARQRTKKYPNMMPPEGTFMHWFLTNTTIHIWISLGTLASLATFVWIEEFKRNSKFTHMLPAWHSFFFHPIASSGTLLRVLKIDSDHKTALALERRKRKVDDVAKRAAYRKAHGLDQDQGFGGWTLKTDEEILGPGIPIRPIGNNDAPPEVVQEEQPNESVETRREKKHVKKWLGIW